MNSYENPFPKYPMFQLFNIVFLFALVMLHPDCFPKIVVSTNAKSVIMKEVVVYKKFTTYKNLSFINICFNGYAQKPLNRGLA